MVGWLVCCLIGLLARGGREARRGAEGRVRWRLGAVHACVRSNARRKKQMEERGIRR